MQTTLDYLYKNEGAFSREQLERLGNARVAVGGLGAYGTGAIGLAQLGVGRGPRGLLRIADPDTYERHNANRQMEASVSQIGRNKTDVIAARIRDLIPEIHLETVPAGVTMDNLDAFLDGVDLVVDAVDFLRPDVKLELHRRARARGIPVATGLLVNKGAVGYFFAPDSPSFERFFAFPSDPELRRTWLLPRSRIMPYRTTFPYADMAPSPVTAERHHFEVLTGQRHITSNSMAASALTVLINHMATSWLLDEPVPRIPTMAFLDPTTFGMGTIDLAEAMREQEASVWTRMAAGYDRALLPAPGARNVYTDVLDRLASDLASCERVLEAGVGTGLVAERLAGCGVEVHGIDRNLAMLAFAVHRAGRVNRHGPGRMYVGEGDVEALFYPDAVFDGYCSNNVVLEADLERALREAWRVLKPGGILAVNSFMALPDVRNLASMERLVAQGMQESVATRYLHGQTDLLEGRALPGGLHTHGMSDVLAILADIGFGGVVKADTTYAGANFYVVARK